MTFDLFTCSFYIFVCQCSVLIIFSPSFWISLLLHAPFYNFGAPCSKIIICLFPAPLPILGLAPSSFVPHWTCCLLWDYPWRGSIIMSADESASCIMMSYDKNVQTFSCFQNYLEEIYSLHGHLDARCTQCPGKYFYNVIKSWEYFHRLDLDYYWCPDVEADTQTSGSLTHQIPYFIIFLSLCLTFKKIGLYWKK